MPNPKAKVVERYAGRAVHVLGADLIVKIASRDTDGAFCVFEGDIAPLAGPPLHIHHDQDECFHIMQGEFRFVVDGAEVYGRSGDTVFAPRGSRHTFQNIGDAPGRLLTTAIPGGLDTFFEELESVAPRGTAPDVGKLLPVFHKHRMELAGPPLAAPQAVAASGAD